MGNYEGNGVRMEEVRRKAGSVWVVYDKLKRVVIITHDRSIALTFLKPKEERK